VIFAPRAATGRERAARADHAADPIVDLDVVAEGNGIDEKLWLSCAGERTIPRSSVEQRPDVENRLELVAPEEVEREVTSSSVECGRVMRMTLAERRMRS